MGRHHERPPVLGQRFVRPARVFQRLSIKGSAELDVWMELYSPDAAIDRQTEFAPEKAHGNLCGRQQGPQRIGLVSLRKNIDGIVEASGGHVEHREAYVRPR